MVYFQEPKNASLGYDRHTGFGPSLGCGKSIKFELHLGLLEQHFGFGPPLAKNGHLLNSTMKFLNCGLAFHKRSHKTTWILQKNRTFIPS
jgi:hypothetical protein